jgi:hypothetical protein
LVVVIITLRDQSHSLTRDRSPSREKSFERQYAVPVAEQQIARRNPQTGDPHRLAKTDDVHECVRGARARREQLKACLLNRRQVARRAVGDVGDTLESTQNVRVDLSDERAQPRSIVQVLRDDDPGRGRPQDVAPPVGSIRIQVADRRRCRATDRGRDGVAHDGRLIWKSAANTSICEAFVPQPHVERLNRVRDGARIESAERLDESRRERIAHAVLLDQGPGMSREKG